MDKRDLSNLNREELVDLVVDLANQKEEKEAAEQKLAAEGSADGAVSSEQSSSIREKHKELILERAQNEKNKIAYRKRFWKILGRTLATIVVVVAIAVLISTLFMPVIQVSGDSMSPTLNDGDVLVLFKTKSLKNGDICCISWQNKLLLKRVIGLPGDSIDIKEDGTVFVNGKVLDEPYLIEKSIGISDMTFPYVVPGDSYFVMGDKRSTSIDSRNSLVGNVGRDQIVGKMLFRIWKSSK